jgi:hypothetical protein
MKRSIACDSLNETGRLQKDELLEMLLPKLAWHDDSRLSAERALDVSALETVPWILLIGMFAS